MIAVSTSTSVKVYQSCGIRGAEETTETDGSDLYHNTRNDIKGEEARARFEVGNEAGIETDGDREAGDAIMIDGHEVGSDSCNVEGSGPLCL